MPTLSRSFIRIVLALLFAHLGSIPGSGYEIETHEAITQEAVRSSSVHDVLRNFLGLRQGINTSLGDTGVERTIQGWASEGAKREDDSFVANFFFNPYGRFLNHFHHPLRAWDVAGLSDSVPRQTASPVWAQTRGQSTTTGSWSWQETRDRYFLALTSAQKKDRDASLAQTFRGLVPSTRNRGVVIS